MKRLLPFLKPYWHMILLAIVLLYIMSNADLALPDYLSQIVNVGIQQNGVESAVPQVLRPDRMDTLALLQTEQEHSQVLAAYDLIEPGSPQAAEWAATYPGISETPVYLLNTTNKTQLQNLESLLSKPMVLLYGFEMIQNNPEQAANLLGSGFAEQMQAVPPGTDIQTLLTSLPEAQRMQLRTALDQHMANIEGTILHQLAVKAVGSEYAALGADLQKIQTNYILRIGALMLAMALLAAATSVTVSYLAAKTSASVARDVRGALFKHVEEFSSAEFTRFSTASLITRSTNDITQIQNVIYMTIRLAFMAPLMGIGAVIRAVDKSPNMWWLIALAVAVMMLLVAIVIAIAVPKFKIMQRLVDRLNLVTRENLSGLMVVRAFNKQEYEEKRFDDANTDITKTMLFVGRTMVSVFPLINLVNFGLMALIIWVGAKEIAASTTQVGNLMAFQQYAMYIMHSFIQLSMLFIMLPRAAVSGDRIADVLETEIEIKDPADPVQFPEPVRGRITFHDVDFHYPDAEEDVLQDVTFTAEPGQVTAIIGSTGSGKSTLVNLVPRFFEVSKGRIEIDGVDIRSVTQHALREQIGFVPQRGLLFSGSIASNLQVAKPEASEADMTEAIEIAQASEFVFDNSEGLQAPISQGGANVSGGQKQRLSIARALVKKPPIYIFDDSFSALDFKTDAALRQALKKQVGDSTVLIVTQRVATAKNSDQILVLDNGRLVGKGTHRELMQTCQTYQEIANSQLSKQELA